MLAKLMESSLVRSLGFRAVYNEALRRGHPVPSINADRLLSDLAKLRTFGTYKTGVHRLTFSPEDIAARQWLTHQMPAAGLDAKIDGIGNVFGFSRAPGRKVLAGSHVESQNYAGWLDGPLGVI